MRVLVRFAASALLAIAMVPAARAGDEVYLRWDNCVSDGGTYNRVFACDTNVGTDVLVGSFRLDQPLDQVSGFFAEVEVRAQDTALQPWWLFRSVPQADCRIGSLQVSFIPFVPPTACLDLWSGHPAAGGFSYALGTPELGRISISVAVPSGEQFLVPAGKEIVAFQMRIDHARTAGQGSCAGCSSPMCLGVTRALITQAPGHPNLTIWGGSTPDNGSNVTWQPGAVATTWFECMGHCSWGVSCLAATPTQVRTWGSIKSLYR